LQSRKAVAITDIYPGQVNKNIYH